MTGRKNMNNNRFSIKDTINLTLIYFFGLQLVIPVGVGFVVGLLTIVFARPDLAENLVLLNFLVFTLGTAWVVYYTRNKLNVEWIKFNASLIGNVTKVLRNYIFSMIAMIAINMLFLYVFKLDQPAANQAGVEEMLSSMPLMMMIVTVIYAPVLEEIVFRGGLYLGLKEKTGEKSATLISALVFGAIHVLPHLNMSNLPLELLFLIPYTCLGYFMVKSVRDTKSLMGGILFHFINNLLATLTVLL